MISACLLRQNESDQGTFGTLGIYFDGALCYHCFTGELPWRDNQPLISRIPSGIYECLPWHSPKYPNNWTVSDVPGRSAILIHSGNFCGDTSKGYLSNVLGCILVGRAVGTLQSQKVVLSSRAALQDIHKAIGEQSFRLVIKDAFRDSN